MERLAQARLSWLFAGLLAVLCGALLVLQHRWIGEISRAEGDRLRAELRNSLVRLSRDFNREIGDACSALLPGSSEIEQSGVEIAYAAHYARWKESHERLFSRIALVIPHDRSVEFLNLDLDTARFAPASWPPGWSSMQDWITSRMNGAGPAPFAPRDSTLIDMPRFGRGGPGMREKEWLIAELNLDYIRGVLLPELLQRHLGGPGKLAYQTEVVTNGQPSQVIYRSGGGIDRAPDAAVPLLEINYARFMRREGMPGPPPASENGPGRWRLLVRHQAGSLEAMVSRARWRNLALSAGILLLIMATTAALVRFSRQAQRLAEIQMNFVAGVSHELRTPLTVIRTAAYNLRGKLAGRPDQVERYGTLIQEESEKLSAMVEQVLQFASTKAGHVVRQRAPVAVEPLIDSGLSANRTALARSGLVVDKRLAPGLPLVLADEVALKHALQNLVDNALKYGTEGSNWIGIYAAPVADANGRAVEIRVADRGPGIPLDEQASIFDPFFRGRRAVQDLVHGTGLGLNLVKQIVEAHGGTIRVQSEPMKGTEFIVRIPAAPPELQDEFAHSVG
jgi:signal transduction histidine kinase